MLRIALCGYEGEGHEELEEIGWDVFYWTANGGFANVNEDNKNRHKERIWFSPHCINDSSGAQNLQLDLF